MGRPTSSIRQRVLGGFATGARASAYSLAAQLGLPERDVRTVCQNARRAGDLAPVGNDARAGSCRPVTVYQAARFVQASPAADPWHAAMGRAVCSID